MSILCKWFGHKMPPGYDGDRPYMSAEYGGTDGIDREHWRLYTECDRCHQKYHVAYIHGPLISKARQQQ